MKSPYQKNFTKQGYLMKYEKLLPYLNQKNWVMQFHVVLNEIEPPIWRRIQVPYDYNFWDLHVAIQDAMGWLDYHLHHFEFPRKGKRSKDLIGIPDFHQMGELDEVFPGWEIPVKSYFKTLGIESTYEYDYGDGWLHTVKLEGYMFREKGVKYPICLDGARACPPEDCGGFFRYENLLKIISDPSDPEFEAMRAWLGPEWQPELFNKEDVKFDNPHKRWQNAFLKDQG